MTSKQRAYLRSLANTIDSIYQIGKAGINPEVTEGISEALEARELVKINVLKNCMEDPKEISSILSERTQSVVVQQIGRKIVLYRAAKKPIIELPKISK
ncbi:MAG: ribosome assembly RNA-binding protein YhbY [Vallitaleaceae bacterium]|nr:ribosome assembly RNA-binding protein YhbY [Vallitaleaceae bacterium]